MTTREKEMLVTLMTKAVNTGLWDNVTRTETFQWMHGDEHATAPQYASVLIGWIIPEIGAWRYEELMEEVN